MARLRFNNQQGTLGAQLNPAGTTINFGAVPSFTTVAAPDTLFVTLEAGSTNEEIVTVTAYTPGLQTATILAASGTHLAGKPWVHGPTAADFGNIYVGATKYDVRDYGAIPDGTTDNVAFFNAALADVGSKGGGDIGLVPGTFALSSSGGLNWVTPTGGNTTPCNNTFLKGSGKDVTIISTVMGSGLARAQGQQTGGVAGQQINLLTNAGLEDLTLQGPVVNSALGGTTLVNTNWFDHFYLRRVKLLNSSATFLSIGPQNNCIEQYWLVCEDVDFVNHTTGSGIESIRLSDLRHARFNRCTWTNFEYAAVSIYTLCQDIEFNACRFGDSAVHAFQNSNTPLNSAGIILKQSDTDIRVINCRFQRLWGGPAVQDGGGSGAPDNFGYFLGAEHVQLIGNTVLDCAGGFDIIGGEGWDVLDNDIENCQNQALRIGTSAPLRHSRIARNTLRNNGRAGGSSSLTTAIYIMPSAALFSNADIDLEDNFIGDDQVAPTQLSGIALDINNTRTLGGYRFSRNDLTKCQTPVKILSGTFAPNSVFRNNPGYNPLTTLTPPALNTAQTPVTPAFNADARVYLGVASAGTVTGVAISSTPTPTDPIVPSDQAIGGGTFSAGATYQLGAEYRVGATDTPLSTTVPIVPAGATDQILVCSIPAPGTPVLSNPTGNGNGNPAGTYAVQATYVTEVGEGPPSPSSNSLTITNGQKFTMTPQEIGTSTGTSSTTLTDSSQNWVVSDARLVGRTVASNNKTGTITGNTATQLTVGSWTGGTPASGKTYAISLPPGVIGMNVYFVSPSPSLVRGLVDKLSVTAVGTPSVSALLINQLPFIVGAPTVAPPAPTLTAADTSGTATATGTNSLTDGGASWTVNAYVGYSVTCGGKTQTVLSNTGTVITTAGNWNGGAPTPGAYTISNVGQFAIGTYTVAMTYLTGTNESVAGPTTTVTLTSTSQVMSFPQGTLDTLPVAYGQINVVRVRYYSTGGTAGQTGLLLDVPVSLQPTGGAPVAAAGVARLILSNQLPPTIDLSIPPTLTPNASRGITAGWRVPVNVTAMRFWISTGGSAWRTDLTPGSQTQPSNVNANTPYTNAIPGGIVPPFLLTSVGTSGTAPTVDTTGITIATGMPASFRLLGGESFTLTASVTPSIVAIGE